MGCGWVACVAVEADAVPGEGAYLLGAGVGEQGHDDVGVQRVAYSCVEDGLGLVRGERFRLATAVPVGMSQSMATSRQLIASILSIPARYGQSAPL